MFKDLVKEKKVSIEKQIERCPFCGSYLIQKGEKKATIDNRWTRKIVCRVCNKKWTIVYNEDQSPSQITFEEYLKNRQKEK